MAEYDEKVKQALEWVKINHSDWSDEVYAEAVLYANPLHFKNHQTTRGWAYNEKNCYAFKMTDHDIFINKVTQYMNHKRKQAQGQARKIEADSGKKAQKH